MRPSPLDCRACGACCVADREDDPFVGLDLVDVRRLSLGYRARLVTFDGRPVVPEQDGDAMLPIKRDARGNTVCAALRGTPGTRVACGIYERRPDVCKLFQPGGEGCWLARRALHLDGA